MKPSPAIYLPVLIFCLFVSCTKAQTPPAVNPPAKYKLVWSDEFNYTGLPDPAKWGYEHGFIRNNESQYYTYARKQNAYVHDGVLEIKGIREDYPNEFYIKGSANWTTRDSLAHYTSACLVTLNKESWKYGRIEIRAKIPKGQGVWPAIWMLGADAPQVGWPQCGETDIMEFIGRDSTHIYGTIHYAAAGNNGHASSGSSMETPQPYNNFHIYALEWDSSEMKIFFDDSLYHTFEVDNAALNGDNPFRKPFYLLLNLALGGAWGGPVDDNMLPQSFLIDYVRVYAPAR